MTSRVGKVHFTCLIGLTPAKYPVMLITEPMSIDPPATEIITALFVTAFELSTWKGKFSIPLKEIKFPSIIEQWSCGLLFYDKEGKLLLDAEPNPDEQGLAGGQLLMQERLVREGYLPHWYICPPQMPKYEYTVWEKITVPTLEK